MEHVDCERRGPGARLLISCGAWLRAEQPSARQTQALLDKLRGFWEWAKEDDRLIGMAPWHMNDRSSGMGVNMGRGAINFPSVLAELRAIMKLIDGS